MNNHNQLCSPSSSRWWIGGLMAVFAAVTITAQAATEDVSVKLIGKQFGHGKSLAFTSGAKKTVFPSKLYTYKISGTIRGKDGDMKVLFPNAIPLDSFLNSLKNGRSSLLSGSFANPGGELPVTLSKKSAEGAIKLKGIGEVRVKLLIAASIAADGQLKLNISKVRFTNKNGPLTGTLVLGKGSTLSVSTAPILEFKALGQAFLETAGTAKVVVRRLGNPNVPASVSYSTQDGTAIAGTDYQAMSGIIEFAANEKVKVLEIPIIDRQGEATARQFTLELSSPSDGALLGNRTTTNVTIQKARG